MEYSGEGFWVDENMVGHHAHFYQAHVCDPKTMAKWRQRLEQIAEITGDPEDEQRIADIDLRQARNEADQESARAAAEKFACARCNAQVGHPCIHLGSGQSAGKSTLWPHKQRLMLTNWYEQRG